MRRFPTIVGLLLVSVAAYPQQVRKPCKDLKADIEKKIDANGASAHSLEIVERDKPVTEGAVVGFCDGGTKKIVYVRTSTPPQPPAPKPAKP